MTKERKISMRGKILCEFSKPQFKYKGISVNLFGLPSFYGTGSKSVVLNELSRLKREGLIGKDDESWHITKRGQEYVKRRQESLSSFDFSFSKSAPKNLIVMFDIPEDKKAEREWFRFHLKKFGYQMIQKSVWVGPSPLPADFLDYIKEIKLKDCIKTFKLAKAYAIK